MKYPISSLSSLATNLRVAIEAKDFDTANELYSQFKTIVEHHLRGTKKCSKKIQPETILPKCSKTLQEEINSGNFLISELNIHLYTK
jgi:hypothetical protein